MHGWPSGEDHGDGDTVIDVAMPPGSSSESQSEGMISREEAQVKALKEGLTPEANNK